MKNSVVHFATACILTTTSIEPVLAQADRYPIKAIRWIVAFPPGGSSDVLARLVSPKFGEALGQQIIVDNRSGAAGTIGTVAVARAAPDGYTVLSNTLPFVANPALHSKPPYDVLRDFEPVMLMANQGSMLAFHPSVPVKNVRELIALAKARPGQLNYGTAGPGSNPHIAAELFSMLTGDPVSCAEGLNQAAGFLRAGLFKRLHIHTVPTLHFHFDRTTERAADMNALIAQAVASRSKNEE